MVVGSRVWRVERVMSGYWEIMLASSWASGSVSRYVFADVFSIMPDLSAMLLGAEVKKDGWLLLLMTI